MLQTRRSTATRSLLLLCVFAWLALVPLRAWAQTAMPWTALASQQWQEELQPPCHGMVLSTDSESLGTSAQHGGTCADCALCHGVVVLSFASEKPPLLPLLGVWTPGTSLAWQPPPLDALFRPPRD